MHALRSATTQLTARHCQLHTVPLLRHISLQLPQWQHQQQRLHTRCSLSAAVSGSDASKPAPGVAQSASPPLKPSQTYIVLPSLAPRMEQGSVSRWLVKEGERLEPYQVFMHVETSQLTEDGSPYTLEVESHESGVLHKILAREDSEKQVATGTPIAVFEDPDWAEGDPPRGDFLWQAYVKAGALRQGSCTPQREESPNTSSPTEAKPDAKASKKKTTRAPKKSSKKAAGQ